MKTGEMITISRGDGSDRRFFLTGLARQNFDQGDIEALAAVHIGEDGFDGGQFFVNVAQDLVEDRFVDLAGLAGLSGLSHVEIHLDQMTGTIDYVGPVRFDEPVRRIPDIVDD